MPNHKKFTLAEAAEFRLAKVYHKEEFVGGLIKLFRSCGLTKQSKILDAGCGSGFPALDLIKRGYNVTGVDKSRQMIRQCRLHAKEQKVSIKLHTIDWQNLASKFDAEFDCVYCIGDSITYVLSWGKNSVNPVQTRDGMIIALKNFLFVLKPGGMLYVDTVSHTEKTGTKKLGGLKTDHGEIEIFWNVSHDVKNKIRHVTVTIKNLETKKNHSYHAYSYLTSKTEMADLLDEAGFERIKSLVKVKGETNYDGFLAHKPLNG
ncbi:MAG: class I SAM-dependent methyltransferase [bacterium]|nr:class I SAM-dependent methyltransferase [bacterium]